MKNKLCMLLLVSGIGLFSCAEQDLPKEYTDSVNVFIGTGGHGHTFPGATLPHGMVQLSPDTRLFGWDACSGYYYDDTSIMGFTHTHLSGTGIGDYGDILFMPVVGEKPLIAGTAENPDEGYRSLSCRSHCPTKRQKRRWASTPSFLTMKRAPMQATIKYV